MSKKPRRPMQPFGDSNDPRGFWRLLQEHVNYLRVRNFSEATIRKRALYVRTFALWCLKRDLSRPDVITKPIIESFQRSLYRARKENGEPLAWSSQHLQLKEVRAFFEVFYSTGIRRAELCALRIDDIQVDRQCLFVNQGKGKKDRYVPIGMRALVWIARYVEQARDRLLLEESERTLFVTVAGEPINPDSLTEYARRYIRSAGITKPGACHLFRHTMATLMHEAGADLSMIQLILGHAKTETTQIYARTSLKRLLEVHGNTHPAERKEDAEDEGKSSSQV